MYERINLEKEGGSQVLCSSLTACPFFSLGLSISFVHEAFAREFTWRPIRYVHGRVARVSSFFYFLTATPVLDLFGAWLFVRKWKEEDRARAIARLTNHDFGFTARWRPSGRGESLPKSSIDWLTPDRSGCLQRKHKSRDIPGQAPIK